MDEEKKEMGIEEAEDLLQSLSDNVKNTFNTGELEGQVSKMLEELRERESRMRETVESLERTKNTLRDEILRKGQEEIRLHAAIKELDEQKAQIEYQAESNRKAMEEVTAERERLNTKVDELCKTMKGMHEKLGQSAAR